MERHESQTICAPATPPGRAALAIVRISGPDIPRLVSESVIADLEHRVATLVGWRDAQGRVLDQAVATWFNAPRSYTGEDLLELSVHGNPLIVHAILMDLHARGIRLAQPGEFTLRAVRNGRMDLARAESVAALVDAETGPSLEAARGVLLGGMGHEIAQVRDTLLDLSARLELETDFAEEEAVPGGQKLTPHLDLAISALDRMLHAQERAERHASAPRVVLAGRPNAGKSSLVNALLGEDRLLVSAIPGTTRDWIEVPIPTSRGSVHLCDTAGLADARDDLDAAAQERTRALLVRSALRVLVAEAGRPLGEDELRLLASGSGWTVIRTKIDLHPDWIDPLEHPGMSTTTGAGIEAFRTRLAELLGDAEAVTESVAFVGSRQRDAARDARAQLVEARAALEAGSVEIAAWNLRQAVLWLEDLMGPVPPQEVLARVFSSFCIGK